LHRCPNRIENAHGSGREVPLKRVTRLFKAWKGGGGRRGGPPPPDPSQPIRVDRRGEKVVEVMTSPSGDRRVGITRESSGLYRLRVETWAPDWEHMGVATWFQSGDEGLFAEDLERARSLAAETLGLDQAPHGDDQE
jgi:hypothetical protein